MLLKTPTKMDHWWLETPNLQAGTALAQFHWGQCWASRCCSAGPAVATHELGKATFWPTEFQHSSIIQNGFMSYKDVLLVVVSHCEYYIIIYWKTLIIWVLLVLQPNPYHMMDANEKVVAKQGDMNFMNLNMIYELARSLRKSTAWGVHPSIHASPVVPIITASGGNIIQYIHIYIYKIFQTTHPRSSKQV